MKCGVTISALNFLGIIFFKVEYNKLFEILSKPFLIFGIKKLFGQKNSRGHSRETQRGVKN